MPTAYELEMSEMELGWRERVRSRGALGCAVSQSLVSLLSSNVAERVEAQNGLCALNV